MKAIICTAYGGPEVLKLQEIEKPVAKNNDVIIKVRATSISSGDARMRRADPFVIRLIFGFTKPRKKVLGVVLAGEVDSIGKDVTKFKVGDAVFGTTGMRFGAHAEYASVAEDGVLALKPNNLSFEEAASIPFGGTASNHFLRLANIKKGQQVLIYGASGALGSSAIQLAQQYGAEVTGVCGTGNMKMVKDLGADYVIDYTQNDFTKNGIQYDVIYDTVGKVAFPSSLNALKKGGIMLLASATMGLMLRAAFTSLFGNKKIVSGVIKETAEDMEYFKKLVDAGQLKPVIDKIYPLSQFAEASAHVDGGHKKGEIIIQMP